MLIKVSSKTEQSNLQLEKEQHSGHVGSGIGENDLEQEVFLYIVLTYLRTHRAWECSLQVDFTAKESYEQEVSRSVQKEIYRGWQF